LYHTCRLLPPANACQPSSGVVCLGLGHPVCLCCSRCGLPSSVVLVLATSQSALVSPDPETRAGWARGVSELSCCHAPSSVFMNCMPPYVAGLRRAKESLLFNESILQRISLAGGPPGKQSLLLLCSSAPVPASRQSVLTTHGHSQAGVAASWNVAGEPVEASSAWCPSRRELHQQSVLCSRARCVCLPANGRGRRSARRAFASAHRLHPPVWLQWLTVERFFGAGKDLTKVARASDVTVSPEEIEAQTITVTPGQAHLGDLRSTSGLGLGDGLLSHTSKWMQVREV